MRFKPSMSLSSVRCVPSNWHVATLLWPSQYFYVQSDPSIYRWSSLALHSLFISFLIGIHFNFFIFFFFSCSPLQIVSRQLICKQSYERYAFRTQRALCQIVKYLLHFTLCNIFRANDERKAASEKRDVNLKFQPIDKREWKKAIKIEHKDRLPERGGVWVRMYSGRCSMASLLSFHFALSLSPPHFFFITNEQRSDPNQKWKWRSSRASVINELAVAGAVVAAIAADFCIHIPSGNFSFAHNFFGCLFPFLSLDNKWQPISGKMREICSLKKFFFSKQSPRSVLSVRRGMRFDKSEINRRGKVTKCNQSHKEHIDWTVWPVPRLTASRQRKEKLFWVLQLVRSGGKYKYTIIIMQVVRYSMMMRHTIVPSVPILVGHRPCFTVAVVADTCILHVCVYDLINISWWQ